MHSATHAARAVVLVERVVVHSSGRALVHVSDVGLMPRSTAELYWLIRQPSPSSAAWRCTEIHQDFEPSSWSAKLSSILVARLPAWPTAGLLSTSQLPSMLCTSVARGAVLVAAPRKSRVTDADAVGGRPGLTAAPPLAAPQPAPARAGQSHSPWPAPSTALHAICQTFVVVVVVVVVVSTVRCLSDAAMREVAL